MTKLYTSFAALYDEMYRGIFDYEGEFRKYNRWLKKIGAKSVLEIGCGSGHLLKRFEDAGYNIEGLDLSSEMLEIAKKRSSVPLHKQDMRKIELKKRFDAVIITGRSFTYMTTNADVLAALHSIRKILKKGGYLIFDNFHAPTIFTNFQPKREDDIKIGKKRYIRRSKSVINFKTGATWDWTTETDLYENGKKMKTAVDSATLRAFFPDELKTFLKMTGFKVKYQVHKNEKYLFTVAQTV